MDTSVQEVEKLQCMDVSKALSSSLQQLARESSGCKILEHDMVF